MVSLITCVCNVFGMQTEIKSHRIDPLLLACAYANGDLNDKKEAFNLAKSCFRTLLESDDMEPCLSCYTNFFLVISRLLKPGEVRDMITEATYKEASMSNGKIEIQVLKNFRNASPAMANKLLSDEDKSRVELPRNKLRPMV